MVAKNLMLKVEDLSVSFKARSGPIQAVRNVTFSIKPGEVVALVGESGSGKSTIGLALMRLLDDVKKLEISGKIFLRSGESSALDLMDRSEREMREIRGNEIAMIFQEPMSSLNPIFTIKTQIVEAILTHQNISRRDAYCRALEMLKLLSIPDPEKCLSNYPHQISGGMRQRVMIAMALSCEPCLLIADEPTTALDVTIQAQIVDIMKKLQKRLGMSILFITHDLGLVSEIADRVLVLYGGQVVEVGDVKALFASPFMPYTQALLKSIPKLGCSELPNYRVEAIPGSVPDASAFPNGCTFHPRCRHTVRNICDVSEPILETVSNNRQVRCCRWFEIEKDCVS